ncbi:polyketide synthase, partial [Mycobacterium heidelbergense]
RPWPAVDRPRRAGVSSFGISGTNAHVIVEEPPAAPAAVAPERDRPEPVVPWVVSARSEQALAAQAARLLAHLSANPGLTVQDVGWSLATTRSVFEHRAVLVGADRDTLMGALAGLASGDPDASVRVGRARTVGKIVFAFPGQGSQWLGMGAALYERFPVFAGAFDQAVSALDGHTRLPLRQVMWGGDPELLESTEFAQPALFALEVALAALWQSWSVVPDVVMGHSVGELAAAYVAGAMSLADAARVVAARGRLMAGLPADGVMMAVAAGEAEVAPLLTEGVSIAAINGPEAVVLSGEQSAVEAVTDRLARLGRRVHRLAVSHAFHSPLMEPMMEDFAAVVAGVSAAEPRIGLVSNVTGRLAEPGYGSPAYWVEHVRQPVRFLDGVRTAQSLGTGAFVEVGPGAALTAALAQSLTVDPAASAVTMAKDRPEIDSLLLAAGSLFAAGVGVDWAAVFDGVGARPVALPTYAFQRRRFWLSAGLVGSGDVSTLGLVGAGHGLLGAVVERPDSGGVVLTGRLSVVGQPWLADHAVAGAVLFPGAGFVELVLRAADEVGCSVIGELTLSAPLVLPTGGGVRVQVVVGAPGESGNREVSVYSLGAAPGSRWVLHAEGEVGSGSVAPVVDLSVWPPVGAMPVDVTDGYERLAARGYAYGPAFRGARAVWRRGAEIFAEVEVPRDAGVQLGGFGMHPVLLDAALHALGMDGERDHIVLPFSWQGVCLHAAGASRVRVRLAPAGVGAVSVELADGAGLPVLSVRELVMRPASPGQLSAIAASAEGLLEVAWSPVTLGNKGIGDGVVVWEPGSAGAGVVRSVHEAATEVLGVLRSWLGGDGSGVLVVLTCGAVGL